MKSKKIVQNINSHLHHINIKTMDPELFHNINNLSSDKL